MQNNSEREGPALEEAQEWIRKGSGLCARLQEEREDLVQRIAAIDAALAALPGGATTPPEAPTKPRATKITPDATPKAWIVPAASTRKFAKMSVPDLIRHVLTETSDLSSPALIKELQALRPNVDTANVYSALHRMKDVRGEGARGAKTYSIVAASGEQSA